MPRHFTAFYRYRSFSINTLESLCRDTLYFAHPGTFNDPLDCCPSLESDCSVEELRKLLFELIRRRVKSEFVGSLSRIRLKGERATAYAERNALAEAKRELSEITYHASNPDHTGSTEESEHFLLINQIQRELHRFYDRGVCCFSTTYLSPLLWSHYGDQHRGLCIGYGLERRPIPQLHSVVYGGNRTIRTSVVIAALVKEEPSAKKELDRDVLLRKARCWNYEKEYRLLGVQGEHESPLLLKEITFGLRCPASVQHAVIAALKGLDAQPRYFQIHQVSGRFRLSRSHLETSEMGLPATAQSGIEIFGDVNDS